MPSSSNLDELDLQNIIARIAWILVRHEPLPGHTCHTVISLATVASNLRGQQQDRLSS